MLKFPEILRELPLKGARKSMSYVVEAHFTSIPIKDTIDYIIDKIYEKEKLQHLWMKLIFRRFYIALNQVVSLQLMVNSSDNEMGALWEEVTLCSWWGFACPNVSKMSSYLLIDHFLNYMWMMYIAGWKNIIPIPIRSLKHLMGITPSLISQ